MKKNTFNDNDGDVDDNDDNDNDDDDGHLSLLSEGQVQQEVR